MSARVSTQPNLGKKFEGLCCGRSRLWKQSQNLSFFFFSFTKSSVPASCFQAHPAWACVAPLMEILCLILASAAVPGSVNLQRMGERVNKQCQRSLVRAEGSQRQSVAAGRDQSPYSHIFYP